jgi:hypothetical protein
VVRISIEHHVGIGVQLVVEANLPHGGAIEVRLSKAEDDEEWNETGELSQHQPACALASLGRPLAMYGPIRAISPAFLDSRHLGELGLAELVVCVRVWKSSRFGAT